MNLFSRAVLMLATTVLLAWGGTVLTIHLLRFLSIRIMDSTG